jgi:putative FmdB family regulatory protein
MPTYEYLCDNCGYEFEKFQSITAKVLRTCPKCKKNHLKRLIGAGGGLIFKGNGFYQTDYRSESYKKAVEEEKGSGKKEKEKSKSEDVVKVQKSKDKTESKNEKKSA